MFVVLVSPTEVQYFQLHNGIYSRPQKERLFTRSFIYFPLTFSYFAVSGYFLLYLFGFS